MNSNQEKFSKEYCEHGNLSFSCKVCRVESNIKRIEKEALEIYTKIFANEIGSTKYGENIALLKGKYSECFQKLITAVIPNFVHFFNTREKLIIGEGKSTRSSPAIQDSAGAHSTVIDLAKGITYHEIVVNDEGVPDPTFKAEILTHELGHAIENNLIQIAQENKRRLCEDRHRWANLISLRLLYPELIQQHSKSSSSLVRDTIWCIEKLCEGINFDDIHAKIAEIIKETKNKQKSEFEKMIAIGASPDALYDILYPHFKPDYKHEPFGIDSLESLIEEQ